MDSTGIKAEGEGEGEWHARKHGGAKRRLWRKIHIGVDEQTLEIRAIEITGSNVGDAPMLPELLEQIPAGVEIGSVTADGAYDTRKREAARLDDRRVREDSSLPPEILLPGAKQSQEVKCFALFQARRSVPHSATSFSASDGPRPWICVRSVPNTP